MNFGLTPLLDGTFVELFIHDIENTGAGATQTRAGGAGGWTVRHLAALKEIVERAGA